MYIFFFDFNNKFQAFLMRWLKSKFSLFISFGRPGYTFASLLIEMNRRCWELLYLQLSIILYATSVDNVNIIIFVVFICLSFIVWYCIQFIYFYNTFLFFVIKYIFFIFILFSFIIIFFFFWVTIERIWVTYYFLIMAHASHCRVIVIVLITAGNFHRDKLL